MKMVDEKPTLAYLNRHILTPPSPYTHHNISPQIIQNPPLHTSVLIKTGSNGSLNSVSPPPASNSRYTINSPMPPASIFSMSSINSPHIISTGSTIKYCNSSGLETVPLSSVHHIHHHHQQPSGIIMDTTANIMNADSNNVDNNSGVISTTSSNSPTNSSVIGTTTNLNGGQIELVMYSSGNGGSVKKSPNSPTEQLHSNATTPDTTKKSTNTRRPEKPNMSYINMIAMAIKASPDRMLTLSGIYNYLQQKWVCRSTVFCCVKLATIIWCLMIVNS